jgi:hypothetical protein
MSAYYEKTTYSISQKLHDGHLKTKNVLNRTRRKLDQTPNDNYSSGM